MRLIAVPLAAILLLPINASAQEYTHDFASDSFEDAVACRSFFEDTLGESAEEARLTDRYVEFWRQELRFYQPKARTGMDEEAAETWIEPFNKHMQVIRGDHPDVYRRHYQRCSKYLN